MLEARIRGIEFRMSLLFPAILVLLFTVDRSGIVEWCVAASILHEAGHFIAMYALGCRPAQVIVGFFGVCVVQDPTALMSYRHSRTVALAGPAVNLLTFLVMLALTGLSMPCLVHLIFGMFNLMPVEPLDGGQALYYTLLGHMEEERAGRILTAVSILTLIPMATAGFYLLIRSGYNFTLIAVSLYLGMLLLFKRRR